MWTANMLQTSAATDMIARCMQLKFGYAIPISTSDSFLFPSPKPTKHHTIVFSWRQLQGIVRTPSHAHLKGLKTDLHVPLSLGGELHITSKHVSVGEITLRVPRLLHPSMHFFLTLLCRLPCFVVNIIISWEMVIRVFTRKLGSLVGQHCMCQHTQLHHFISCSKSFFGLIETV